MKVSNEFKNVLPSNGVLPIYQSIKTELEKLKMKWNSFESFENEQTD